MSTETLSFNGRVNIACDIVKRRYREALLLGAGGNSREATTDPAQIEHLVVKFRLNEHECVIIFEKDIGVFEKPRVVELSSDELKAIDWPIDMSLVEANALKQAKYPEPYTVAGLMHRNQPEAPNPQYFFQVDDEYIKVDTVTQEVTRGPIDELRLDNEDLRIIFNLKYEVAHRIERPAKLVLEKAKISWGRFTQKPPREITSLPGHFSSVIFSACGVGVSGTTGEVWYRGTDPENTRFKITWDIPRFGDNKVSFTGDSRYYSRGGGAFDPKSPSQIVTLEIKQVEE